MPTLADYLELTEVDAATQWRRILERVPQRRQDPYLPVEAVLCFGLFYLLNPRRFGGANIHTIPVEATQLARLFVRSPGSITNKMLNLEGRRANGGRLEPTVFLRLRGDRGRFEALYRRIFAAARALGIGPDRLPDFVGAEHADVELLGQEELGDSELRLLELQADSLVRDGGTPLAAQETTRLVIERARLGQHRFARAVLANYDHRCGFCGFAPRRLPGHRLLVASHIKPWRASTDRERLDPRNGVAACPIHDSAFDTGLLTVNGGLRIHRSPSLQGSVAADEGVDRYFGEPTLAERLLAPEAGAPARRYLDWHRRHVFKGDRP